jgi:UDP-glucose:(heptosyl)LPS alpha-1,3-glucosyltransferase
MKLAFCLFRYFPFGGLQRDFLRIARLCRDRGHDIHVYTMAWEGAPEPAFHVHLIAVSGWQNHTRLRAFVAKVTADLLRERYDRVIGLNKMPGLDLYYAGDVCYAARAREQHGWWYRCLPRYRQLVALERAVFARGKPTKIMLLAPSQQQAFTTYYQTESERFHLLPPGIERARVVLPALATEKRQAIRDKQQVSAETLILLMVGSGFKTKGLDRIIRGLGALPSALKKRCQLWVVGQDSPHGFLRLAQRLKVASQIHFLGGRENVTDFFLAADLLLHPAYHENTGTVLLEALVAGLPVLTIDVCGYAHYVAQAQGGIVLPSPFQQTQLNQALERLLLAPEAERVRYRHQGHLFAQTAAIYHLLERATDLICQPMPWIPDPHVLFLHPSLQSCFSTAIPLFEQLMSLRGDVFRQQKGRITQRVLLNGTAYFIKQHHGVGWREIGKNLLQLRWPVLSARNEWRALQALQAEGLSIPVVFGYGSRHLHPAKRQSFILLEALTATSLEAICARWRDVPPTVTFKWMLLKEVAHIVSRLHRRGLYHRDLYLCHFLLHTEETPMRLSVIDWHRAQIRTHLPERLLIKDLGGLYFSAKQVGLTTRDYYRFMRHYRQTQLRAIWPAESSFWKKVYQRGEKLYRAQSN